MNSQYQAIDRETIWAALYTHLKTALNADPWQASTAYLLGAVAVDPQGHLQKVTTAGTTGASAPSWNDAGGTTADGTATWTDTGAGVVSIGRKHKAPPSLTLAEQPALFVVQGMEEHVNKYPGTPTRLVLHGFLILYLAAPTIVEEIGEEELLAATMLNQLLKAIDAALLPDDDFSQKFTLGGLVTHCWIEGETRQDPAILGPQAAALVPVHILVP